MYELWLEVGDYGSAKAVAVECTCTQSFVPNSERKKRIDQLYRWISRSVADQFWVTCETGVRNYIERSLRESLIGLVLLDWRGGNMFPCLSFESVMSRVYHGSSSSVSDSFL